MTQLSLRALDVASPFWQPGFWTSVSPPAFVEEKPAREHLYGASGLPLALNPPYTADSPSCKQKIVFFCKFFQSTHWLGDVRVVGVLIASADHIGERLKHHLVAVQATGHKLLDLRPAQGFP